MEKDLYGRLTNEGNIIAVKLHCDFMDIGIPKDYIKFCQWVKEGKLEKL
jgi:NDP-sugar pyrophosphorylase family protein